MKIVIVGGGAGGLELATRLGDKQGKREDVDIVLVDGRMTHLWKPRLHEVAAGMMNADLDELNYVAHAKKHNFRFVLGFMDGVDRDSKQLKLGAYYENGIEILPARTIDYDHLVISVGSKTNDFNTKGVADHCITLDTREAAEKFHQEFLKTHLKATHNQCGDKGQSCSIAIVGAGATGVELAAELAHSAKALNDYGLDGIDADNLKITVISATDRVLPQLSEKASAAILKRLEDLGVKVLLSERVTEATEDGLVTKGGGFIPASLKVWSAGIKAPAFLSQLSLTTNRIGQLEVNTKLQTADASIFAFGDCAACPVDGGEGFVPARAAAANQQAKLLAKSLEGMMLGRDLLTFKYKEKGSLISVGDKGSVGDIQATKNTEFTFEGKIAKYLYVSLYRMHQNVLHGFWRTGMLMMRDSLARSLAPSAKLHSS